MKGTFSNRLWATEKAVAVSCCEKLEALRRALAHFQSALAHFHLLITGCEAGGDGHNKLSGKETATYLEQKGEVQRGKLLMQKIYFADFPISH